MTCCLLKQWPLRDFVKEFLMACFSSLLFLARKLNQSSYKCWDQLEYTAPTGFRFLGEPMFYFSTLNANTNPNPNLIANTVPAKPAWAPTLATNTVAKPAWVSILPTNMSYNYVIKYSNRNPTVAVYSNRRAWHN